jgi:catechol 2,3-dioxygenase-like lactoylglutathione lyase family enzyme
MIRQQKCWPRFSKFLHGAKAVAKDTSRSVPQLLGIHHFTIRCTPAELGRVQAFYCDVLGMKSGPRPAFNFPGDWLYVGETAVVHLAAILPEAGSASATPGSGFDHVSLHARGLEGTRQRLKAFAISYEELPVPGWPLQQIFLLDPVGSKIELTFEVPE